MPHLNRTHDPSRRSWVESANTGTTDFPIQNLPFGVFSTGGGSLRVGTAIGDYILDLAAIETAGLVRPAGEATVFAADRLNPFMALPQSVWLATRARLSELLDRDNATLRDDTDLRHRALIPMADATLHLPFFVRSYTDFYASKEHATNVGSMFRDPDNALLPNWLHLPIGYNGRASTVVVSGTEIPRPHGQLKSPANDRPRFAPCEKLDIELELGAVVGTPSPMGTRVSTADAYDMIFGYVLLNDWSARDIQVWEYQPLGPFQSKAFATTISPWVVTREALEPYRVNTPERLQPLLPYLEESDPNNFDLDLEVELTAGSGAPVTITRTNYRHMYYSAAQQLAHHTSSGCAMCTGDLLGSGTISGPTKDSFGSLLELTWNGRDPLTVPGGQRVFLEDSDSVSIKGWCDGGRHRIGFGDCAGRIVS